MARPAKIDYAVFIEHYLKTGDPAASAKAAGSKATNSGLSAVGARLLHSESIGGAIRLAQEKVASQNLFIKNGVRTITMSNERIASITERQEFWTAVMRDDSVETKDRLKASEILGKAHGDFIKRIEVSTSLDDELVSAMKAARERVNT